MKLSRRSWLLSSAAVLLLPKKAWAVLRKHGGAPAGGGNFPAGVTLQPIDGGATYYADNSFTLASASRTFGGVTFSAGWDDPKFIPIGAWLNNIANQTDANRWIDLGLNTMYCANSAVDLPTLITNGISLIQLTGEPGAGESGGLVGTGAETVGMMTFDEPNNWAEYIQGIGGAAATFQATMSGGVMNVSSVSAGSTVNNGILTRNVGIVGVGVTPTTVIFGYGSSQGGVAPDYGVTNSDVVSPAESMSITYPATANAIQDHRFWWINNTNAFIDQTPGTAAFTPSPNTVVSSITQPVATPAGVGIWATRHINWISIDAYLMSSGSNFNVGQTQANIYGIFNIAAVFQPLAIGTGPLSFTLSSTNPGFVVGGVFELLSGAGAMFGTINTINLGTGAVTSTITSVSGSGSSSTWSFLYGLSAQQMNRAVHYGDQVDAMRSVQVAAGVPAPTTVFLENGDPFTSFPADAGNRVITSAELNASAWAIFIHGARQMVWFNSDGSGSPSGGLGDNFASSYYQTIHAPDTISMYDRAKATHKCIAALAPVINSQFAVGYVTVNGGAGAGFSLPLTSGLITAQNGFSKFNGDLSGTPGSNNGKFECMAKYYNFTTQTINGITLTQGKFWVFGMYRGPEADTNIAVNFTIKNTSATTATRFLSDSVLATSSSDAGTTTTIQVGDASAMVTGDIVTIMGSNQASLNNVRVALTKLSNTSIKVPIAFPGAVTFPFGVMIVEHTISISSFTVIADTFPTGNFVGIYRVN